MDGIEKEIDDIRYLVKEAKVNHAAQGFKEPAYIVDALNKIADLLEKISADVRRA